MKVKLILPALLEATDPGFRPIKYALFPPLGLASLAGYLDADDEVELQDEHVQRLTLGDDPDLVVIRAAAGERAPAPARSNARCVRWGAPEPRSRPAGQRADDR